MPSSKISQQPSPVSPVGASWIQSESAPSHTCAPPSASDPSRSLNASMAAVAVLTAMVILALLCRLAQLHWRLRATRGSGARDYCSFYHWGRYTLKEPLWTTPGSCPLVIATPSLPLPPPPIPIATPVLYSSPPSSGVGQGDGAMAPSDWELYSRIRAKQPPALRSEHGTRVFLFEHSAF